MRHLALPSLALVAVLVSGVARADDEALARTLFDEGIKALDAADYATACPKLEESLRLKANANVQFYLAECLEHQGKTASAWTNFLGAAAKSKEAGKVDKAAEAKARADALQPKLVWVTIVVETPVEGLEVNRGGSPVPKAQWGVALPVDPGELVVTATAPGKEAFRTKVQATAAGAKLTVTIRELDDSPTPKVVSPPVPVPSAQPKPLPTPKRVPATSGGGSSFTVWTFVLGGAALAGTGTYFLIKANQEKSRISGGELSTGNDISSAASTVKSYQTTGFIGLGVGSAMLVTGIIIGLATGNSTPVTVGVGPNSVALAVSWRLP